MGDYLEQQYVERDLAKSLAKVHGIIDDETKKLSDRVKELTLSYNRMKKLLKMSLTLLDDMFSDKDWLDAYNDAVYLHKRITLEFYGLEGYKGLKGGK